MEIRQSCWGLGLLAGFIGLAGAACGGPEEEPAGEAEEEVGTLSDCSRSASADATSDVFIACQVFDASRRSECEFVLHSLALDVRSCSQNYAVRRCYDPLRDRHVESLSSAGCAAYNPDFSPGTPEGVFYFALTPQAGADPRPLFRCRNGGNDRTSRSPTCDDWNKAPLSRHGYSYAPGAAGTTPVYRCKRNRAPNDWFLSRQANCEGHLRQELLGYARESAGR